MLREHATPKTGRRARYADTEIIKSSISPRWNGLSLRQVHRILGKPDLRGSIPQLRRHLSDGPGIGKQLLSNEGGLREHERVASGCTQVGSGAIVARRKAPEHRAHVEANGN